MLNRSNKLKPFWLSITEKETLPVLDFLSAALLSAEYDRALSRALAMAECPVVPFFGAFLRELREILSSPNVHDSSSTDTSMPPPTISSKSKMDSRRERDQQRQVVGEIKLRTYINKINFFLFFTFHTFHSFLSLFFCPSTFQFISDYNGEDHHFTKIGPGGLINLEKIYRTQAVMDHIALCHQHYHTRNRLSPTTSLFDYLRYCLHLSIINLTLAKNKILKIVKQNYKTCQKKKQIVDFGKQTVKAFKTCKICQKPS